MISTKDQEELFALIANYLETNLECIAIGGTAMMLHKYKTTTKDIDLIFKTTKERNTFINAIEQLGYTRQAPGNIYDTKRKEHEGKPLMFTRGDERFDLFVKNVFGYVLEFEQNKIIQRNDFLGKQELTIYTLSKEELILLKAITGREKDFEDIETILHFEKNIDWNSIITNAIAQKQNNQWILIDLEQTIKKLQKTQFIKEEYVKKLYQAQK